MRKRQLKRLEAKRDKLEIKIEKANMLLSAIDDLSLAVKALNNNPSAHVSIAVISNNQIIPVSNLVNFSHDLWCEIFKDSKKDFEKEFKKL